MTSKRLALGILYCDGKICISRNYKLQYLGDYNWLLKKFNLASIIEHIDEVILINASTKDFLQAGISENSFESVLEDIIKQIRIPITVGGNIQTLEVAKRLFRQGADRVLLRTNLQNEDLVNEIQQIYGDQSILGWIDYANNHTWLNISNKILGLNQVNNHIANTKRYFKGEYCLNNIDRDGTGFGYDVNVIKEAIEIHNDTNFIISGGVSTLEHYMEILKNNNIQAVSTSNLLAQIGGTMATIRKGLINIGMDIAIHDLEDATRVFLASQIETQ